MADDDTQALIHGGGPKVGRIHYAFVNLSNARRTGDVKEMYYNNEDLFREVEAYLNQSERENILPIWNKVVQLYNDVTKGMNKTTFYSETLLLELKLRRVIKRLKLDMGEMDKEKYTTGAIG